MPPVTLYLQNICFALKAPTRAIVIYYLVHSYSHTPMGSPPALPIAITIGILELPPFLVFSIWLVHVTPNPTFILLLFSLYMVAH